METEVEVGGVVRICGGWVACPGGPIFSCRDGVSVRVASVADGERNYGWRETDGRLVGFFLSDVMESEDE